MCEVELITLVSTLIRELGLKDAKLHINSIGDEKCKPKYNEALVGYLEQRKDKLCTTCQGRMYKNPLRVLDCKEEGCKAVVEGAPRTIDYLCDDCKNHFETLCHMLDELEIPYEIDTEIVRGLDYYTKTVFEFVNSDGFTLCGGGRYDNLVHEIDGKESAPSVGFGMGIERILYFLEQDGINLVPEASIDMYVGIMGDEARAMAYKLVRELRENGLSVETDCLGRSVKAQMKYANKLNARYSVIIGESELDSGKAKLKEMESGEETEVRLEDIAAIVSAK